MTNILRVYIYRDRGNSGQFVRFGVLAGTLAWHLIEQAATTSLWIGDSRKLVVRWSADSSTIVWQDRFGIWHWNLFEEATLKIVPGASDRESHSGCLMYRAAAVM